MAQQSIKVTKRTVYIGAYATDDGDLSPEYAKLIIDQAFYDKLVGLQNICINNNLSEVRQYDHPEWGPGELADDLRLSCGELVVTGRDFWFTDIPKHANYRIETKSQDIDSFLKNIFMEKTPLFFGCEPEDIEIVED